jgi:hypothetical protein
VGVCEKGCEILLRAHTILLLGRRILQQAPAGAGGGGEENRVVGVWEGGCWILLEARG